MATKSTGTKKMPITVDGHRRAQQHTKGERPTLVEGRQNQKDEQQGDGKNGDSAFTAEMMTEIAMVKANC